MFLGVPQNTTKSHLVFTALFCFAPFSVFSSSISAPYFDGFSRAYEVKIRPLSEFSEGDILGGVDVPPPPPQKKNY
jgi:hypothetical protein